MNYLKTPGFNLSQSWHWAYITYSVKTWFSKILSVFLIIVFFFIWRKCYALIYIYMYIHVRTHFSVGPGHPPPIVYLSGILRTNDYVWPFFLFRKLKTPFLAKKQIRTEKYQECLMGLSDTAKDKHWKGDFNNMQHWSTELEESYGRTP